MNKAQERKQEREVKRREYSRGFDAYMNNQPMPEDASAAFRTGYSDAADEAPAYYTDDGDDIFPPEMHATDYDNKGNV